MSFAALPPELYSAILSHVSPLDRQVVTLNLSRAIPLSPVPLHSLFEHVVISRQQQVPQLYRRLHYSQRAPGTILDRPDNKEVGWVKSFILKTWQVDADVLVNLLALLPAVEHLHLSVGTLFSPEHLEDLFRTPAPLLHMLSLRFRPYVEKATYYQFLKGSYFDSTIELISCWPRSSPLSHLSIIQDPLPRLPTESNTKPFAQPIVFFSLAPLTSLGLSSVAQRVTHLRLRIPSRQLVRFIAPNSPGGTSPFSALDFLDLSTTTVRDVSDLEALLIRVANGQLQHLVLDKTGLCDGTDGEWENLGRTCALAGVKRAREREKALKVWVEAESAARARTQDEEADTPFLVPVPEGRPRARRGRRGLATATISLRDASVQDALVQHSPVLPHLPLGQSSKAAKIRILPPFPRLRSLDTSISPPLGQHTAEGLTAHVAKARSDFAKGWSEGLDQLRAAWARLRQSQSNGVRVIRFAIRGSDLPFDSDAEQGRLAGLEDVGKPGSDAYWEELQNIERPVLCFAGARGEQWDLQGREWLDHPEGCGHRIAWDVWKDNL